MGGIIGGGPDTPKVDPEVEARRKEEERRVAAQQAAAEQSRLREIQVDQQRRDRVRRQGTGLRSLLTGDELGFSLGGGGAV